MIYSVFTPSHVIKEDHLDVVGTLDCLAVCAIARIIALLWVNIDQLPVALVPEHETLLGAGISPKVWRVIYVAHLRFPAEK